jgi:mannose-6-phosphate isomerase-like protein (cupin superfamily)
MKNNILDRRNALKTLGLAGGAFLMPAFSQGRPLQQSNELKPVYVAPGGGEKFDSPAGELIFKLNKEQTAGNVSVHQGFLNPGILAAPPHFHRNFEEICFVQEGTLSILCGDEIIDIPAGGWHLRPRGIVHTFWNSGTTPVKHIELFTPGGFEDYLRAMAQLHANGAHPSHEIIGQLAKQYDVVLRMDLLQGITEKYKVHL